MRVPSPKRAAPTQIISQPDAELKWHNIDADDLPTAVKKSFDAMVEAEATFKADSEKPLKNEGHMPEDKFLVLSRKGKRLGVAYASTPRSEGGAGSLKFKIQIIGRRYETARELLLLLRHQRTT
jgi:hypothetical protein